MSTHATPIGQIDGATVRRFEIAGPEGMRLAVLDWGARLAELHVPDRAGQLADVVLGHDTAADWAASSAYLGATCGRSANRIGKAGFMLDGRQIKIDANEGSNHLHGGTQGFDRRVWALADSGPAHLRFTLTSLDGDMGYPGALQASCLYRLEAGHRLRIEITADVDKPCPVNIVNHAYFNLAGAGAAAVTGHVMRLHAEHYLPVGPGLIPTGEIRPVAGGSFDFRAPRAIGADMPDAGGYDHNFCLSEPLQAMGEDLLRPCAEVVEPGSGRQLRLWTNQPGVQLYTGGGLGNGLPPGKNGHPMAAMEGFCLETQAFPDSPNKPQFPSSVLRPGETFRHVMLFDFSPAKG